VDPQDWRSPLRSALMAVGLDLESVASMEAGDSVRTWIDVALSGEDVPPTPAIYLALSDLTGIEPEVLTGEVEPAHTLAVAMRSRGQTASNEMLDRSLKVLRAARAIMRLQPNFDLWQRLQTLQTRFPHTTTAALARSAGQQAARVLRAEAGIGNDPILDLSSFIEELGIPVEFSLNLPSGLHGATSWTQTRQGWIAAITINAHDLWTVQRYSLAHELSHVLHRDRPADLTTEVWENTNIGRDPMEVRAESFASNLLAPRAGLATQWTQERLGAQPVLIALARVMWNWGLSREAAGYALQDCSGIPWSQAETEAGKAANVGHMIRAAGLEDVWAEMQQTEHLFVPSAWLAEASALLFARGQLPVENFAAITDQEPTDALSQLLDLS
jgi:Zn-dependent peptidase ImmA (M78 family)